MLVVVSAADRLPWRQGTGDPTGTYPRQLADALLDADFSCRSAHQAGDSDGLGADALREGERRVSASACEGELLS